MESRPGGRRFGNSARRLAASAAVCAALTGCQGIAGSPQTAQLRIIDASPNAPGLDIYQGSSAIAYNLGFGTVTSYIPVSPGTYTISLDRAASQQVLSSVRGTVATGGQYTVLASNVVGSLQTTFLKDQTAPAPAGQVGFRFLDETTQTAAVDVYLLASNVKLTATTPVYTGITFGGNSGYINLPYGAYSIVVLPTGTVPTAMTVPLFTGSQISYPGGAVRTVIILDQPFVTPAAVQAIVVSDFDSAAATS